MRITDAHIDGFGVWHDLSIRKLSPEVTAFYGPNEAGKTTLMQFLRSVLYGMSAHRRKRYLPPIAGGRPGGWLEVDGDDGRLKINRIADRSPSDVGKVTIVTPDGNEHGDRMLREALENVDEITFNNVFAVGLKDIQELGSLDGTAAAQWLYRLTSGIDRVSLYDLIHMLRESLLRIVNVPEEQSELRNLLHQRDKLQGEFDELVVKGRRWAKSAVQLGELSRDIDNLQAEAKRVAAEGKRVETATNLKPLWAKRDMLDEEIAAFDALPRLPDAAIEQLEDFGKRIEEHQRQRDILRGQRHQLRDEADALGINDLLVANCCRLEGLEMQQGWLEALEREIEELEGDIESDEARIEADTERLSERWLAEGAEADNIAPELLGQLEPQARAIQATETLVERAQENLIASERNETHHRTQLEATVSNSEKRGLPKGIEEASDLVASLRHRLQVEQKVDKTRRAIRDLEQQNYELAESQMMPLDWFTFLLVTFIVSTALIGSRLFGYIDPESGFYEFAGWAGGIGLAGSLFAIFWKYVQQQMSADRLDEWFLQMEDAEIASQEAKKEQQRLMRDMPMATDTVKLRLEQAEKHLGELERTLPVENDRQAAAQEIQDAQQRLQNARQKHQAAWANWKSKLHTLGLAETVTPGDLETTVRQYQQLEQLEERAGTKREECERRTRDYELVTRRIQSLAEEVGLVLESEDASHVEQLAHLLEASREQKARLKHREGLRERAKEMKAQEAKHARAADGLGRRREVLFQQCGVDSEQALRHLADQHDECAKLRDRRQTVCREITAAIGRRGTEEDFAPLLAPDAIGKLEQVWESVLARGDEIDAELKKRIEERGKLIEQQRRLADDRSLGKKQIEIDELDIKIRKTRQGWRERAVVYHMLERIRDEYERDRQPETLQEASTYMRKLTSGRYKRVWTPLANDVLMIDTAEGESLPVELLSTGTREQLYVSLRMAMVAMFARRGVQLPMILDDVFVNFDVGRTRIAIEVLRDFAKEGHQLLVFTCHEHVWRMFQELKMDARRLPDRYNKSAEAEVVETPLVETQTVQTIEEEIIEGQQDPPETEVTPPPPPKPPKKRKPKPKPVEVPVEELEPEPLPVYDYDFDDVPEPQPLPEYEYAFQPQPAYSREVEYTWPDEVREPPAPERLYEHGVERTGNGARPLLDPIVEPYSLRVS